MCLPKRLQNSVFLFLCLTNAQQERCTFKSTHTIIGVLLVVLLENRWPWFTWWFNHPPGSSISPKRTPMRTMSFLPNGANRPRGFLWARSGWSPDNHQAPPWRPNRLAFHARTCYFVIFSLLVLQVICHHCKTCYSCSSLIFQGTNKQIEVEEMSSAES